jgi:hypothetical protein
VPVSQKVGLFRSVANQTVATAALVFLLNHKNKIPSVSAALTSNRQHPQNIPPIVFSHLPAMVVCAHSFYLFLSLIVFWSPKSTTDVSNYILTCIRRVLLLCVLNIFLRVPHQYCCVCASSQLRVQLDNKWRRRRRRMPLISKPRLKRNSSVLPLALRLVVMSDRLLHTELVRVYFFLSFFSWK